MTAAVSSVATVHEQMHNYAETQQRDQQSVAGKDVNTMLKSEQKSHCTKERQERYPCTRLPEATAAQFGARFVLMVSMRGHFPDTLFSII
jgi:hypothetical protein